MAASNLTIAPHTYRKIGYDPLRDFVAVGTYVKSTTAVCVHGALPVKTVPPLSAAMPQVKAGRMRCLALPDGPPIARALRHMNNSARSFPLAA